MRRSRSPFFTNLVFEYLTEWTSLQKRYGIVMAPNFEERLAHFGSLDKIEQFFKKEGTNSINVDRLKALAKEAFDGLEPSDSQMKAIIRKLDTNGDGTIELEELKAAAVHMAHMFYHEDNHDHSSFAG